ncbi:hypothetical protein KSK37_10730 [Kaistella sp. DKR-2]|uniref:hypothetical protein n=1 Tax=Kaistella soli TaxID=2849654 RepID=UPI001C25ABAE|nr:hypothetical protein [Kaistella soli]MBU8883559.1 hypothetical protein [Kaistella soli]
MRIFTFLFLVFSITVFSQKNRNQLDVVSNIEAKVIAMKPIGNNSLAKNLMPFYGFGFGGNLMTPINFGIGLDYSQLFSNVHYDQKNLYGNLGSPRITQIDAFLTHRENISEDFMVEEMAGFSFYRYSSLYIDEKNRSLKDQAMGFNLGGKAIYTLDGPQQVFVAGKINFYYGNTYNENPEIKKYYSNSTFLSLSLGYRYNF